MNSKLIEILEEHDEKEKLLDLKEKEKQLKKELIDTKKEIQRIELKLKSCPTGYKLEETK